MKIFKKVIGFEFSPSAHMWQTCSLITADKLIHHCVGHIFVSDKRMQKIEIVLFFLRIFPRSSNSFQLLLLYPIFFVSIPSVGGSNIHHIFNYSGPLGHVLARTPSSVCTDSLQFIRNHVIMLWNMMQTLLTATILATRNSLKVVQKTANLACNTIKY